jgi:hypothetical protein
MNRIREIINNQFSDTDYIPPVVVLYYLTRTDADVLRFNKIGLTRESTDQSIESIESLGNFERWCSKDDIENAMKNLLRWSYHRT